MGICIYLQIAFQYAVFFLVLVMQKTHTCEECSNPPHTDDRTNRLLSSFPSFASTPTRIPSVSHYFHYFRSVWVKTAVPSVYMIPFLSACCLHLFFCMDGTLRMHAGAASMGSCLFTCFSVASCREFVFFTSP